MIDQALRREENKDEVLQGKFHNLNFSPSTKRLLSILLNLIFFLFRDIRNFFSSLKPQYCRTIVLLNKLKLLKKPQAMMVMRLPAKKIASCPKVPRDFPPRPDGILLYPLGLPFFPSL